MLVDVCASSSSSLSLTTTTFGVKRLHGATTTTSSSSSSTSCSTTSRSTRGASKQRRDQINLELAQIRHILPLAESTKERLYQLQVMALCCVWIRKYHALIGTILPAPKTSEVPSQKCRILHNYHHHVSVPLANLLHDRFLLAATEQGKLITLSDNFHTDPTFGTEEFVAQGDSLYDLVDSKDHAVLAQAIIEAQNGKPAVAFPSLLVGKFNAFVAASGGKTKSEAAPEVPTAAVETAPKGVFTALCRPLRYSYDASSSGCCHTVDPDTFRLWLSPALQIVQLCTNAKIHLKNNLSSASSSTTVDLMPSLYHLIHPNCVPALANAHKKLLNLHQHNHQFSTCGGDHLVMKPVLLELITSPSSNGQQILMNVADHQNVQQQQQQQKPLRVHAVLGLCQVQQRHQHDQQQQHDDGGRGGGGGDGGKLDHQLIIEGIFQVLSDLEADAAQKAGWMYSDCDRSAAIVVEKAKPQQQQHRFRSFRTADQHQQHMLMMASSAAATFCCPSAAGIMPTPMASSSRNIGRRPNNGRQNYAIGGGCQQNWHHLLLQQQLSQQQQQQNCGGNGTKFVANGKLLKKIDQPQQQQPVDLNNNSANTTKVVDVHHDDEDDFFQLPSLCDGHQLPELDDRDLDEFFRQVESGTNGGDDEATARTGRDDQLQNDEMVRRKRKKDEEEDGEEEKQDNDILLGEIVR